MIIEFYEYGSNKLIPMHTDAMDHVPQVGEFVLMLPDVTKDWEYSMCVVRAVTHTLSEKVMIHVSRYSMTEEQNKDKQLKELLKKWREAETK